MFDLRHLAPVQGGAFRLGFSFGLFVSIVFVLSMPPLNSL
ncbi:hypothetical protein TRICHSKD4_1180 [Roseibium sp. TrichSKD4]|nr:hypothetical protein TRICHSKD4_1180 [Roseibium sp. TrichSKD4]